MSGERISFPWPCEVTGRAEAVGSVACLCRGCRGAALETENARLRAEIDGVDLALEGLEETERGRRIGRWIGEAADATTRANQAEADVVRLREALNDILKPFPAVIGSAEDMLEDYTSAVSRFRARARSALKLAEGDNKP